MSEKLLLNETMVDVFVLYSLLKRLTTPFREWKAFQLGIIDDTGEILRPRSTLTTQEEKNSFSVFDLLVRNIKRIIEKTPGGKSKIASYVAGLYLIREQANANWYSDEDLAYESFMDFYESLLENSKSLEEEIFLLESSNPLPTHEEDDELENVEEDAPVNSVSGGGVAGLTVATGGPVVNPNKKKLHSFKQGLT